MKGMKNWKFLMLANRLYFQVLPNTQRGWKLELPNVDKSHQMDKSERKLEVLKWNFSPLRTPNLSQPIRLSSYHFRGVNSKILYDWMIMVMINWLILLGVLEKWSHSFFNLKGDFVLSLILGHDNKNITE